MIQVRVLPFGVLKDRLGHLELPLEIPQGSRVSDLLDLLSESLRVVAKSSPAPSAIGDPDRLFQGIAVSVNAEYAQPSQILHAGDEVGLLPPVSGGTGASESSTIFLTRDPIDAASLVAAAKHSSDGAVVVFDGIVRDNTRGRTTLHLDYEAYEEMAESQMKKLAAEALATFGIRQVIMAHRLGRLQVGETSVLIVVASAHRGPAFEACRWLIDTLKKTVPIWKKETFIDGVVWAAGEPFPAEMAVMPAEIAHEK